MTDNTTPNAVSDEGQEVSMRDKFKSWTQELINLYEHHTEQTTKLIQKDMEQLRTQSRKEEIDLDKEYAKLREDHEMRSAVHDTIRQGKSTDTSGVEGFLKKAEIISHATGTTVLKESLESYQNVANLAKTLFNVDLNQVVSRLFDKEERAKLKTEVQTKCFDIQEGAKDKVPDAVLVKTTEMMERLSGMAKTVMSSGAMQSLSNNSFLAPIADILKAAVEKPSEAQEGNTPQRPMAETRSR